MNIYLINYNNGSRWPVLPQNLFHLQKCLQAAGHHSIVLDFNLTKQPYEVLHSIRDGVIGLGFISGYWPHQEALKIAEVIRNHPDRNSIEFVIGGHGPSADPEYYIEKLSANACMTGSADISINHWLKHSIYRIEKSCGYNMDVSQYYGNCAGFDVYKRIRFPNTRDNEFAIQILSGRGCPYHCAFCFRMGEGYKQYETEHLIEDIKKYAVQDGIRHFQFSDELLMSSATNCNQLCNSLLELQARIGENLYFDCNGRLNVASSNPELLEGMQLVGFRYINYGCEAMSNDVLEAINKKQTVYQIKRGVENTLEAGLTPGLNFMWGNPGDNLRSLWDAVDFIKQYNDGSELRTIRPVTPYPGTELYNRLIRDGRCTGIDDFYEHHVNSDLFSYHFMDGLTVEEANKELFLANISIYEDYISTKKKSEYKRMGRFYGGADDPTSFRGFRDV